MSESLERVGGPAPTDERTNELTENRGQNQPSLKSGDARARMRKSSPSSACCIDPRYQTGGADV